MTTHPLALDNIAYLEQGLALLDAVSDERYRAAQSPAVESSMGGHYRHALDHYHRFFAGLAVGAINYDARERNTRVEAERDEARSQTRDVIAQLAALDERDGDRPLTVRMACSEAGDPEVETSRTTLARELQFLISHTVHHYALMAVLLRLAGEPPVEGFGVAPSTLKYQKSR